MKVMDLSELKTGRAVWLESYGYAFKTLHLTRSTVLAATPSAVYFAFPFCRMDCGSYNSGLTWRCWDEQPSLDALAEEEWHRAAA